MELAKWADGQNFERYWVAEHHNSKSISCSATDLIIGYILENTQRIKVGAGGVMLPNHTPFQVAERYGTLETLYPERVDLGIGRAPGTDIETAKLIYRDTYKEDNFKEAIRTLLSYFEDEAENFKVRPYPGVGTHVPIYILGSSMTSAHIAAQLGLPYSFAGHFSPNTVEVQNISRRIHSIEVFVQTIRHAWSICKRSLRERRRRAHQTTSHLHLLANTK